jgi:hypothetical protein
VFETLRIAAGEDRDERCEGVGVDLAGVVVRQCLGEACSLVGVARFVAVGRM